MKMTLMPPRKEQAIGLTVDVYLQADLVGPLTQDYGGDLNFQ
jgi:hypothetical protein